MLNVGTFEFLAILLLALIVLGPDRLPGAARTAGKWMRDLRQTADGFQQEFRNAIDVEAATSAQRPGDHATAAHPISTDARATAAEASTPASAAASGSSPVIGGSPSAATGPGGVEIDGPDGSFS